MSKINITEDLEFYEVINAFPVLRDSLEKLEFNVSEIKEGKSIHDFFKSKKLTQDEIDILIKRLNRVVNHHMRPQKI